MFFLWTNFNKRIKLASLYSPFNPQRAPAIAATPPEPILPANSDNLIMDDEKDPWDDPA
jgi:hypothetical protein